MKVFFLIVSLTISTLFAKSQDSRPGQLTSIQIAKRMKDTLNLTAAQYRAIYQANLQLLEQKMAIRQRFSNRDSLTIHIQKVENSRNKLYRAILDSSQYRIYKNKKISLISTQ